MQQHITKQNDVWWRQVERAFTGRVVVDSRQVMPGDLFVALPGNRVDGHDYLLQAFERGAQAALVERKIANTGQVFQLESTLEGMQQWASLRWAEKNVSSVAITGSYGKTTTRHFLAHLLKHQGSVFTPQGNANSQIGLPMSVLNDFNKQKYAVIELGMTHKGQIGRLCRLFPPKVAIITAVDYVHAINFPDLEAIAQEKGAIFSDLKTTVGWLPAEIAHKDLLRSCGRCEKHTFSMHDQTAKLYGRVHGGRCEIFFHQKRVLVAPWPSLGKHYLHNLLGAIGGAIHLGVDWPVIAEAIPSLTLPKMRFEKCIKKDITFINDAYNACEASMCAALTTLAEHFEGKRRVAVLGGMRELGSHAASVHARVLDHAKKMCHHVICIGEAFGASEDFEELLVRARALLQPEDVVLVKGARAYALERFIEEF